MGVEPFLINSCLTAVIGQRLVRKICRRCLQVYHPGQKVAEKLGLLDQHGKPLPLAKGKGCQGCFKSGYAGREVIGEVLEVTPEIRELIMQRAQEQQIEAAAKRAGMKGLRQHALEKVAAHVTTLEEVFRTTTGEAVGE
jgi:type IV pilus assembly protein PilB